LEALGVSVPGLIGQFINFILLLIILRALAYKPIIRMLDERSARIREATERAEEIKAQAARSEAEFTRQIEEARRQGQEIISQAEKIADRVRNEELDRTRQMVDDLRARALADIAGERERAMADLRRQVADLAVLAAGRAVGSALDQPSHNRLIEEAFAEAERLELK
jgi:F-type H+-transporting ATPase subunit b